MYNNIEYLQGGFFLLNKRYPEPRGLKGVADKSGNIIIPVVYTDIVSINIEDKNYWIVTNEYKDSPLACCGRKFVKKGVYYCDKNIVPIIFPEITFANGYFICKSGDNVVKYNENGEVILTYHDAEFTIPND